MEPAILGIDPPVVLGPIITVLIIVGIIFLVYKVVKVALPLLIAAVIVAILWLLGVFDPILGAAPGPFA